MLREARAHSVGHVGLGHVRFPFILAVTVVRSIITRTEPMRTIVWTAILRRRRGFRVATPAVRPRRIRRATVRIRICSARTSPTGSLRSPKLADTEYKGFSYGSHCGSLPLSAARSTDGPISIVPQKSGRYDARQYDIARGS